MTSSFSKIPKAGPILLIIRKSGFFLHHAISSGCGRAENSLSSWGSGATHLDAGQYSKDHQFSLSLNKKKKKKRQFSPQKIPTPPCCSYFFSFLLSICYLNLTSNHNPSSPQDQDNPSSTQTHNTKIIILLPKISQSYFILLKLISTMTTLLKFISIELEQEIEKQNYINSTAKRVS